MEASNERNRIFTYQPVSRIKITLKSGVNPNVLGKIDLNNGMNSLLRDMDTSDYLSVAKYDVRLKIYIYKRFKFISRVLINGIQYKSYMYSNGFILKF